MRPKQIASTTLAPDTMVHWRAASRFVRTLLVVLAAQVAVLPNVLAYEEGRTEYGARLRLTSLPARVHLDSPVPGFSDGGQAPLLRAIATWNAKTCSSPVFVLTDDEDGVLIEIRPILDNWKFGKAIAAHTDIDSDKFHGDIRHVVIEIDATRTWSGATSVPSDALDLESVLLHELGHALGLAHSRNQDAVMRAGIKPGQTRRVLHDDDAAGACAIVRTATLCDAESASEFVLKLWRSKWVFVTALLFVVGLLVSVIALVKRTTYRQSIHETR